ncbi:MAG: hypothetical protein JO360_02615 [Acidobacteria bacterium]|nr:hypothetical protein [Acidobacteriota bacterium]
MRRSSVFSAALVLFVLALTFSSLFMTRTVQAVPPPDPCVKCQGKCQREYDRCLSHHPVEEQQQCHDGFNSCIVDCFATVCEQ